MNIPLGYEIGTGKRVTIPVNHTVVLGQTQLSGKTTTLEAMVTRSGLRAVGFITKPGEKSFRQQNTIPAFFSESTIDDYWKYVVSIVENLMAVKLGWQERGWIVKLCQDYERDGKTKKDHYEWEKPDSLRELLGNVETALPRLRGTAEMICMQLREYLKAVVREIEKTEFSSKLALQPGINVMDVTELSDGLKALVIRSVIEHVHKHGRKTVVIIPEAWKFIPEGRSTPVKLALEGLIREGAGIGNFVWMDSQDLRGVDKLLLRSVIVWLFGVQRQKNEVASTLASIPDHPKPSATEIMQLGKGEFFVTYGNTLVRTYVQPAGMEDAHAQAIARGDESPDSWRQISKALDGDGGGTEHERDGQADENISRVENCKSESVHDGQANDDSGIRVFPERSFAVISGSDGRISNDGDDETMWQEKYEALKVEHEALIEAHDALAERVRNLESGHKATLTRSAEALERAVSSPDGAPTSAPASGENGAAGPSRTVAPGNLSEVQEQIYRYIVARAEKDPRILAILVNRPELRVTIERQTIEANAETLRGALALLISRKFFDTPQNGNAAFNELKRLGRAVAKPNVYRELDKLAELGFVTKEETGYLAVPGMKVQIQEAGKHEAGKAVAR
jgi:hypothetical protein